MTYLKELEITDYFNTERIIRMSFISSNIESFPDRSRQNINFGNIPIVFIWVYLRDVQRFCKSQKYRIGVALSSWIVCG